MMLRKKKRMILMRAGKNLIMKNKRRVRMKPIYMLACIMI
jgi:hypothetical protein